MQIDLNLNIEDTQVPVNTITSYDLDNEIDFREGDNVLWGSQKAAVNRVNKKTLWLTLIPSFEKVKSVPKDEVRWVGRPTSLLDYTLAEGKTFLDRVEELKTVREKENKNCSLKNDEEDFKRIVREKERSLTVGKLVRSNKRLGIIEEIKPDCAPWTHQVRWSDESELDPCQIGWLELHPLQIGCSVYLEAVEDGPSFNVSGQIESVDLDYAPWSFKVVWSGGDKEGDWYSEDKLQIVKQRLNFSKGKIIKRRDGILGLIEEVDAVGERYKVAWMDSRLEWLTELELSVKQDYVEQINSMPVPGKLIREKDDNNCSLNDKKEFKKTIREKESPLINDKEAAKPVREKQDKNCSLPLARGISFGKTLPELLSGKKTVTRREWTDSYAATFIKYFEEKRKIPAYSKDLRAGGELVGSLIITQKPYKQLLSLITDSDVAAEGFPQLKKGSFTERFFPDSPKDKAVWVIWFEFTPCRENSLTIREEENSHSCVEEAALTDEGGFIREKNVSLIDDQKQPVSEETSLTVKEFKRQAANWTPQQIEEALLYLKSLTTLPSDQYKLEDEIEDEPPPVREKTEKVVSLNKARAKRIGVSQVYVEEKYIPRKNKQGIKSYSGPYYYVKRKNPLEGEKRREYLGKNIPTKYENLRLYHSKLATAA